MPNPIIKAVQAFSPDIIKGVTEWKNKTEERKKHEITSENETKQIIKKAELNSHNNTINKVGEIANNALNQVADGSNNALNQMTVVANKTIDKASEITKDSIKSVNESNNKTIKDVIGFIGEDKKNALNNSKEQHEKLVEIDKSRHKAEIEAVYYRTKEETLSEISKNIVTYAESVKYINEKIKHLGLEIQSKEKKIEFDEKVFVELTQDLRIEESKYQDLNSDFNALIDSIEKLAYEYKDSMEEKEYFKNIKREKRELKKYIDKIENTELKLLNKEKERLIIEKKLKPKLDEIENLKLSLKYLQNERDNNEFKGLLNLSNIQADNLLINSSKTHNEIIDAEIESDKKSVSIR